MGITKASVATGEVAKLQTTSKTLTWDAMDDVDGYVVIPIGVGGWLVPIYMNGFTDKNSLSITFLNLHQSASSSGTANFAIFGYKKIK